jgi:hypothetical protein
MIENIQFPVLWGHTIFHPRRQQAMPMMLTVTISER